MNRITYFKHSFFLICIILGCSSFAQNYIPFTPRFDQDVRGDIILIGNNILGPNNEAFNASQKEIAQAVYTFIILRCPFRRVASAFLDQILEGDSTFRDLNNQKLSINFHEFLLIIQAQNRNARDQHWRNQTDITSLFAHITTLRKFLSKFLIMLKII